MKLSTGLAVLFLAGSSFQALAALSVVKGFIGSNATSDASFSLNSIERI